MCSACGAMKDSTSEMQNSPPSPGVANPARTFQRQKSVSVESRRKRDEKQAKEQLVDIVKSCRKVRTVDDITGITKGSNSNLKDKLILNYWK